jgi:hypothetical protein
VTDEGTKIIESVSNLSLNEQIVTSRKTRIFQNGEINQAVNAYGDFVYFIWPHEEKLFAHSL